MTSQRSSIEHFYETINIWAPYAVYTNVILSWDNGWLVNLCFKSFFVCFDE